MGFYYYLDWLAFIIFDSSMARGKKGVRTKETASFKCQNVEQAKAWADAINNVLNQGTRILLHTFSFPLFLVRFLLVLSQLLVLFLILTKTCYFKGGKGPHGCRVVFVVNPFSGIKN